MTAPLKILLYLALMATSLTGHTYTGGGVVLHPPGPTARYDLSPTHNPPYSLLSPDSPARPTHATEYVKRDHDDAVVRGDFERDRRLYFYSSAQRGRGPVKQPAGRQSAADAPDTALRMSRAGAEAEFHVQQKNDPLRQLKSQDQTQWEWQTTPCVS